MKRKINLIAVIALLTLTTACKKETTAEGDKAIDTLSVKQPATIDNGNSTAVATPADGKYPVITFEEEEHDFGTIQQGDKPTYDFKFKNTGEADLLITSARGSCGCTVPEPPKQAIKPGESEIIKVSFDSKGKSGETTKTVTIMCNTKEGNKIIKIKANIEVPKKN